MWHCLRVPAYALWLLNKQQHPWRERLKHTFPSNTDTKQAPRPMRAAYECRDTAGVRMWIMCSCVFRISTTSEELFYTWIESIWERNLDISHRHLSKPQTINNGRSRGLPFWSLKFGFWPSPSWVFGTSTDHLEESVVLRYQRIMSLMSYRLALANKLGQQVASVWYESGC